MSVDNYQSNNLTIKQILDVAQKKVGERRFYKYDAFNRNDGGNCQLFILDMLSSNHLLTMELKKFVVQDVSDLLKALPEYTSFLSKLSTDLASHVNKIIQHFRYQRGGTVRQYKPIKRRRRDYSTGGGKVEAHNPNEWEKQNRDTIPAILVVGEMVIPKQHVPLVESFLRSKNIYLPGMDKN
jgi:hypothetical protein